MIDISQILLSKGGIIIDGSYVFDGDLNLSNMYITHLPENMQIEGSLWLGNTNITQLPDVIKVGKCISLYNTQIYKLPQNIKIGGTLTLRYCKNIKSVPDCLVCVTLDARDSGIDKDKFTIPSGITGNVYI